MKNQIFRCIGMAVIVAGLPVLSSELAVAAPMKPEMAAKREMVRKQQEQRITPEKRKAAVDALKAERLKIYKAKQAEMRSSPDRNNNQ